MSEPTYRIEATCARPWNRYYGWDAAIIRMSDEKRLDVVSGDTKEQVFEKAQAMTHLGLKEVRRSVSALRASPLEGRALPAALADLAAESDAAGLTAKITVSGETRELSPQAALTLYRAAQEGLTNCRKHSGIASARVWLEYLPAARARLTVADDGAVHDLWASGITADEVDAIADDALGLYNRARRARGTYTPTMVADAQGLADGPMGPGFLPFIAEILDLP